MGKNLFLIVLSIWVISGACSKMGCSDPKALNYSQYYPSKTEPCVYTEAKDTILPIYLRAPYYSENQDSIFLKKVSGAEIDYIVTEDIVFRGDVRIEPGVTFLIQSNSKITFNNDVNANGTDEAPITFLSENETWRGIEIVVSYYVSATIDFNHVIVKNAINTVNSSTCSIYVRGGSQASSHLLRFLNSQIIGEGINCGILNYLTSNFYLSGSTFTGVTNSEC